MFFAFIIIWNAQKFQFRGRVQESGRNVDIKQLRQIFGGGSVNDVMTQTGRFVFCALFSGKPVKIFKRGVVTAMRFPSHKD